ncbi:MAG: hypothetical protein A2X64_05195 [Ignavibacteria bacterium GWF2_33_9]|nr:MAG: hypothetical protein A2X64_05195 [Ignavibacteria bacterium GWF2_33_9]
MEKITKINPGYNQWLSDLKSKIKRVQIKAAIRVNTELLNFYWELGSDIVKIQKESSWGDKLIEKLSLDLMSEFNEMKGFSKRNLELIRKWYLFWENENEFAKQLATQIPWWHNIIIITKIKNIGEAKFYIENTISYNWSRSTLTHQINRLIIL